MKNYSVGFTDGSECVFEAANFDHLAGILDIHCLLSGKEVDSVNLNEHKGFNMEINIWDFVDQKIDELEKFKKEWLVNNTYNPDCYPTRLGLGEWEDQLNATVSV